MALYEVVLSGLWFSQLWQNKLHFNSTESIDADGVCLSIRDNWWANIRQVMTGSVSLVQITATRREGVALEQFTLPVNAFGAQVPEDGGVPFVAIVIQKKTGLAGKSKRGRFYLPGARRGETIQGKLSNLELTNWNAVTNALTAAYIDPQTEPLQLVIKHPEGFTTVTGLQTRQTLGCMRSREVGVGA